MKNNQTVQLAGYERLLAALAKVPPERMKAVDERASIFVSGMEAMARFQNATPEPALCEASHNGGYATFFVMPKGSGENAQMTAFSPLAMCHSA